MEGILKNLTLFLEGCVFYLFFIEIYLICSVVLILLYRKWYIYIYIHIYIYALYGFSGSHVWIWELDYKESWAPKNWYFWTVVLEKTLESPLDCKEIQLVHPKGDQSWIFIEKTDVEAETPILWPPDVKSWLIGKDPDAGKDWV